VSSFVGRLLEASAPWGAAVRRLRLDALDADQSAALAAALLGDAGSPSQAAALATESAGNPFLLRELTRHALSVASLPAAGGEERVTLETVLRGRLAALSPEARRFLEAVAVAGQPVSAQVARDAARVELAGLEVVRQLGATHLVRTHDVGPQGHLEIYHDRFRAAVLDALPPEALAALHRRLAVCLEAAGEGEAETLAVHIAAGGDRERAA